MSKYIGLATGKVAHIIKPYSFVKKGGWNDKGYTLCGRSFNPTRWFESGLDIWRDDDIPTVPICKKCLEKENVR